MAERRVSKIQDATSRRRPATTPEARENQLISQAYDLAEEQIRAGTASAQVISHFLKRGSTREKLEEERLIMENELTEQKIEAIKAQQRIEELYSSALAAMSSYQGTPVEESDVDYDD
jgi:hypothetical protein